MSRYAIDNHQDEHCSAPAEEEHIARRHAQFIRNRSIASFFSLHPPSYIALDNSFIAAVGMSLFKHLLVTVNTPTTGTLLPSFGTNLASASSVESSPSTVTCPGCCTVA